MSESRARRIGPNMKRGIGLLAHCVGVDGELPVLDDVNNQTQELLDNVDVPKFLAIGGIYRTTPPTYTDGQMAMLSFGPTGALRVDTELTLDGSSIFVDNVVVQGLEADAAPLTKAPVPTAGWYLSAAPTYTDGQVVTSRYTSDGKLMVDATFTGTVTAGDYNTAGDLLVAGRPLATTMGVAGFAMSTADTSFTSVPVVYFVAASIQTVWSGGTGGLDGQVLIEISNDNTNWQTYITVDVNAASGNDLARTIKCDFGYIRASWVKGTMTGGTVTISALFKGV